ncbi:Bro-N domain-containing protein [Acinetobacter sp. YH16055]|uniref:BRO-N domain-containing protein n=1 Tax=Acinetobacter sp. YH16055 TaxID=2601193 RepID=UPI001C552823|nr:Bro-N domain-containing protein [Acinetobacter sp. YH16055]
MQLQIFKYENDERILDDLTTIQIEGEVWFVASEVCKLLDIQNVPRAVSSLDDDEKQLYQIRIAGQLRKVNIVSESGV